MSTPAVPNEDNPNPEPRAPGDETEIPILPFQLGCLICHIGPVRCLSASPLVPIGAPHRVIKLRCLNCGAIKEITP